MNLLRKVQAVQRLFAQLDKASVAFKNQTSLNCISDCFNCCLKPDIYASPLEFLPFAYHLYKDDKAEIFLDQTQNKLGTICINLSQTSDGVGGCKNYADRGLICRLFGFSAITDKYSNPNFVTCLPIKNITSNEYNNAVNKIKEGLDIPIIMDYYTKLQFIDPELGAEVLPINEAIIKALETVLWYYTYRTPSTPRKAG
jgi:Fe-S-cluster containining protein